MENTATQAFEELVAEQKRNVIASLALLSHSLPLLSYFCLSCIIQI